MINIGIHAKEMTITVEGEFYTSTVTMSHPANIINLISKVLDLANYGGETICLEFWDETGMHHEVNRWGGMR